MGRGWRNTPPKAKARRIENLPPEVERVYKRICRAAEQEMRADYAREMYEYRVRYRYGYPNRIHFSEKTKCLCDLMERVARKQTSARYALHELERIRNMKGE